MVPERGAVTAGASDAGSNGGERGAPFTIGGFWRGCEEIGGRIGPRVGVTQRHRDRRRAPLRYLPSGPEARIPGHQRFARLVSATPAITSAPPASIDGDNGSPSSATDSSTPNTEHGHEVGEHGRAGRPEFAIDGAWR